MSNKKKVGRPKKKQVSKTPKVVTQVNLPRCKKCAQNDTKADQPEDYRLLDSVETFIVSLEKSTGFSKEQVTEALLYDQLVESLRLPAFSMDYKVRHNVEQCRVRREV